jgi:hypothetical protein
VEDEVSEVVGRWATDPIGKHDFRWHDQAGWTGWVSDGSRRSFEPIGSAQVQQSSTRFTTRRQAILRLMLGAGALIVGIGLSAVSVASPSPAFILVFVGPIIWGAIEFGRAARLLVRKVQPSTTPPVDMPPPVDYEAEVRILDDLVREGRLSAQAHDLALPRLRKKYNVPPPT